MTSILSAVSITPTPCPVCKKCFEGRRNLFIHQTGVGHIPCNQCQFTFHQLQALWAHQAEAHRASQDLLCPGCGNVFVTGGGWVQHVEKGECAYIFKSDMSSVSKGMDKISEALRPNPGGATRAGRIDFSGPSHIADTWGDWQDEADTLRFDVQKNPAAFPRTEKQEYYVGGSKQPDLLTGVDADVLEQHPGNAWAQKKNLSPDKKAHSATPPPPLKRPELPSQSSGGQIIDPDNPAFNVAVFWNPILEQFRCPHKKCNGKFKNKGALVAHLKSMTHKGEQISCPTCRDQFTSIAAWIQHAETVAMTRCKIRDTEVYPICLRLATNGVLDVDKMAEAVNGTVKLKINDNWEKAKQADKSLVPGSNQWAESKQNSKMSQSSKVSQSSGSGIF